MRAMIKNGIKNTKKLLIMPLTHMHKGLGIGRGMSKLAKHNHRTTTGKVLEGPVAAEPEDPSSYWMPHPRSGIYFPKGQDWVMEDIPNDAALFDCTIWFRNIDGVDHKPDQDNFTNHYPN